MHSKRQPSQRVAAAAGFTLARAIGDYGSWEDAVLAGARGGGGALCGDSGPGGNGGFGGTQGGTGGAGTAEFACPGDNGSLGQGGDATPSCAATDWGGGGGGGYYGGGGGGTGGSGGSGGAGSSFWVPGATGTSMSTDTTGTPEVTITPVFPAATTTTTVSAPATGTAGTAIAASAVTATLAGAGSDAGGTITVTVFGPQPAPPTDCTSGGTTTVGTAAVSGPGSYNPPAAFTPGSAGTYWWYASYGGDTGNLPSHSGCGAGMTAAVVTPPPADLALTNTSSPNRVLSGQRLTYTIKAHNTGGQAATSVTLTDPLPASAIFGSMSATQGTCTRAVAARTRTRTARSPAVSALWPLAPPRRSPSRSRPPSGVR